MVRKPNPKGWSSDPDELDRLYAASGGWAAVLDPEALPAGTVFEWHDRQWEVAAYFPLPCCGLQIGLVRRVEEGARSWSGLGCPACQDGKTYTVEQGPDLGLLPDALLP